MSLVPGGAKKQSFCVGIILNFPKYYGSTIPTIKVTYTRNKMNPIMQNKVLFLSSAMFLCILSVSGAFFSFFALTQMPHNAETVAMAVFFLGASLIFLGTILGAQASRLGQFKYPLQTQHYWEMYQRNRSHLKFFIARKCKKQLLRLGLSNGAASYLYRCGQVLCNLGVVLMVLSLLWLLFSGV